MTMEAKSEERPAEPPKTNELSVSCPNGPGKEHEWEDGGEYGSVRCIHCDTKTSTAAVISLYQSVSVEIKKRLDHELGYKTDQYGKTRTVDAKTEKEKELVDQMYYFEMRLQEEIDVVTKMKQEASKLNRNLQESRKETEKVQASAESLRTDRDKWKNAYNGIVEDLKVTAAKMTDRLNKKV